MEEVNITVSIANRQYRFCVKAGSEAFAKVAAEEINQAVRKYSNDFRHHDTQDVMAMICLQNTTKLLSLQNSIQQQEQKMQEQIAELEKAVLFD